MIAAFLYIVQKQCDNVVKHYNMRTEIGGWFKLWSRITRVKAIW